MLAQLLLLLALGIANNSSPSAVDSVPNDRCSMYMERKCVCQFGSGRGKHLIYAHTIVVACDSQISMMRIRSGHF